MDDKKLTDHQKLSIRLRRERLQREGKTPEAIEADVAEFAARCPPEPSEAIRRTSARLAAEVFAKTKKGAKR